MKAPKTACLALAVAVLTAASVQAVPITYSYTGNPFIVVNGPYLTSEFVTASVTLANPLGPNHSPAVQVFPSAFSLFDGVQTITLATAVFSQFFFATGPTGVITNWQIDVFASGITAGDISTYSSPALDKGILIVAGISSGLGESGNPGTWSSRAAVPEGGSSIALLSLSLTALGVAARRFKRAAA